MRNVLLAGAAMLGATASLAQAQTDLPPTYNQGVISKPGIYQGANDSNNYQAASLPGGVPNPTPGSIVVRFDGRYVGYYYDESSNLDHPSALANNTGTPAKTQKDAFLNYFRLYTGVDGLAANGLKYGAAIEIRTNSGPTNGSSANDGSSANTRSSTLYIRREFGYAGFDDVGIIRFGAADSLTGIFDNGVTTFQNFNNNGWNGDLAGAPVANSAPAFPFQSQGGSDYDYAKAVYLSPQVAGFDFGLAYAPNNSESNNDFGPLTTVSPTVPAITGAGAINAQYAAQDGNLCAVGQSGCSNLASSSVTSDGARFKNLYQGGVRYQGKFGPVATLAEAVYVGSGHVNYTGLNVVKGVNQFAQYRGLGYGDFGGAVTFAGVTVGGHYMYGSFNGIQALRPQGGVDGEAWMAGVQYAIGPLTVGTSYYDFTSQGAQQLVGLSQRHETGLDAGFTYRIAPGFALLGQYLYGTRHQGGFNFETGGAASKASINEASSKSYNDVRDQVVGLGTIVNW